MQKLRSGRWIARGGSALKILVTNDKFIGTYSTTHGRPTPQELFCVSGLINEDLIGFTVPFKNAFTNYYSLTTWCGRYELKQKNVDVPSTHECIRAVWHHARMFGDMKNSEPIADWCVFHVGHSEFFWEGELSSEEENIIRELNKVIGETTI